MLKKERLPQGYPICERTVLTLFSPPRYRYGQLIEINSHSLFSKWFSEVSISVTSAPQARQVCGWTGSPVQASFLLRELGK